MRELNFSEVKLLAEAGALNEATLYGCQGKFLLTFRVGTEDMRLIAKTGTPRSFRDLTRAAQLLYELGIKMATLNLAQYESHSDATLVAQQNEIVPPLPNASRDQKADPDPETEAAG